MQSMSIEHARQMNALVLAFVGDSYYSYYMRRALAQSGDFKADALNSMERKLVCAKGQALAFEALKTVFTLEESDIARRARNHNSTRSAKNATLSDYKKATALEAVVGFLVLSGQDQRLEHIMAEILKVKEL